MFLHIVVAVAFWLLPLPLWLQIVATALATVVVVLKAIQFLKNITK